MSADSKRNVYALMIGIDDYPIPHHRLRGCVNDMRAVRKYLEESFDPSQFNAPDILALENDQATRQNIIDGFMSHLTKAQEGDIAFIHYSGHGSQEPAPPEFWHEEPDKLNESMVCYDSRLPGGFDLVGKELSYLIWEVSKNNPHIVVLFDCCHSGSGTRDVEGEIRSRMAEVGNATRPLEQYVGFQHYSSVVSAGVKQVSPPRGRHILLAAAKDNETAKETMMDGAQGGVFTHSLLKVLRNNRGPITYAELMSRVQTLVFNKVDEQHPQLEAHVDENDKFKAFLDGSVLPKPDYYVVTFDQNQNSWVMEGGSMAGIPAPAGDQTTELYLFDANATDQDLADAGKKVGTARVTEVLNDKSLLQAEGIGSDATASYKGKIYKLPIAKMPVFVEGEAAGVKVAEEALNASGSMYVEKVGKKEDARYRVWAKNGQFYVTRPGEDKPLFKRLDEYKPETGKLLVARLEHVAKWLNTFELYNPSTGFDGSEIEITMTEVTRFGQRLAVMEEQALNASEPVTLEYKYDASAKKWAMPWFRMKIKNTSPDRLYVAALYLGADFGVHTDFLPMQELAPGQEVWLRSKLNIRGTTYEKDVIPIAVPEEYASWGTTEVNELFKILVSTVQFNSTLYRQEGLELDKKDEKATRVVAGDFDDFGGFDDWTVHNIQVTTIRPLESVELGESPVQLQEGVTLLGHPGLKAKVNLASQKEATRAAGGKPVAPAMMDGNPNIQDLAFTNPTGKAAPMTVLEISDVADTSAISSDAPLQLQLNQSLGEDEALLPMAYDEELGMFVPVGSAEMDADGHTTISIDMLPTPTPAGTRSLGGSVKILFKRVVMEKLGFKSEYPLLQEGVVSADGNELEYKKGKDHLAQRVAESQRIVMFIHGIIGDTKDMTKAVERGQLEVNGQVRKIRDHYDLVLTFDYENLGTTIENNGRLLKQRLEEVGLKPGHGKTFHIVAHSMGGLVSRWYIEKEGGNQVVNHLIQLGTPNGGSELGGTPRNWAKVALTTLMGKMTVASPFLAPLAGFMKHFTEEALRSLGQMDPGSDFYKLLNDGTDPGIPYSIIYGNTSKVLHEWEGDWKSKLMKVVDKLKDKALEEFLFKSENDIAVRIESIQQVPDDRNPAPVKREVACDHMSYFTTEAGLKVFTETILAVNA